MKKKNGFVFVETMIVVVVLVSILLIIYSSYANLISLEKRQARYDDPLFIYRTYAIGEFLVSLEDENKNSIIGNKIAEFKSENLEIEGNNTNFVIISPSDQDLYNESQDEIQGEQKQAFFSSMYNNFNVQTIILITKSKLKDLKENEVSSDFYRYLKTIDTSTTDDDQIYIAVMYAEKVNGDACDPNSFYDNTENTENTENSCTFYYSNLKIEKEGIL